MNQRAVFLKLVCRALSFVLLLQTAACSPAKPSDKNTAEVKKSTLKYAKRFGVESFDTYTLVSVFGNRANFDTTACFVLCAGSQPINTNYKNQIQLEVPCKRLVSLSCIYNAMFSELGAVESIAAIDNADYVNDTNVLRKLAKKELAEVGKGPTPDLEAIIKLQPDLVLMFGMGNPQRDLPKGFAESKLPVVIVLDHLEEHPIARAEWIKFFAAFVNKQQQADSIFKNVESKYLSIKKEAQSAEEYPSVFTEIKFGEAWYMPGGKSYMSILIADAGGNYLWKDVPQSGSIPLSFEQVLAKAGEADIWLNQPLLFSLKDILAADKRYAVFKAMRTKRVYNNTLHRNKMGYSPYWESGIAHPERILSDLTKIFHPQKFKQQDYYFYEQLP